MFKKKIIDLEKEKKVFRGKEIYDALTMVN